MMKRHIFFFLVFIVNYNFCSGQLSVNFNCSELYCLTQKADTDVIIEDLECLGPGIRLCGYINNKTSNSISFDRDISIFCLKYCYCDRVYTSEFETISLGKENSYIAINPKDSVYFFLQTSSAFSSTLYGPNKKDYTNEIKNILSSFQIVMNLKKPTIIKSGSIDNITVETITVGLPPFVCILGKGSEKSKYFVNERRLTCIPALTDPDR